MTLDFVPKNSGVKLSLRPMLLCTQFLCNLSITAAQFWVATQHVYVQITGRKEPSSISENRSKPNRNFVIFIHVVKKNYLSTNALSEENNSIVWQAVCKLKNWNDKHHMGLERRSCPIQNNIYFKYFISNADKWHLLFIYLERRFTCLYWLTKDSFCTGQDLCSNAASELKTVWYFEKQR